MPTDYSIVPAELIADAAMAAVYDDGIRSRGEWIDAARDTCDHAIPPSPYTANAVHAARAEVADTLEAMEKRSRHAAMDPTVPPSYMRCVDLLFDLYEEVRSYTAALRASLDDGSRDPTMEDE